MYPVEVLIDKETGTTAPAKLNGKPIEAKNMKQARNFLRGRVDRAKTYYLRKPEGLERIVI